MQWQPDFIEREMRFKTMLKCLPIGPGAVLLQSLAVHHCALHHHAAESHASCLLISHPTGHQKHLSCTLKNKYFTIPASPLPFWSYCQLLGLDVQYLLLRFIYFYYVSSIMLSTLKILASNPMRWIFYYSEFADCKTEAQNK